MHMHVSTDGCGFTGAFANLSFLCFLLSEMCKKKKRKTVLSCIDVRKDCTIAGVDSVKMIY